MKHYLPAIADVQLTVDVAIFTISDDQLKIVLTKRPEAPFPGALALPGGFLWDGETSLQASQRILKSKTGIGEVFLEQLYTFDQIDRDERGRIVSVTYMSLAPADQLTLDEHAQLIPLSEVGDLAFDHNAIVTYAITRLRSKVSYTNAVYSLLPPTFTFAQLQRTYEIIFEHEIDKRNFRKKYFTLDLIEPTGEHYTGGRHRPAQYYRFKSTEPTELPSPAF